MKFRPHLAEHSVRRLRITHAELAAAGVIVTFENVLDPATWKDALDLQIGDEVECVGLGWQRTVRVISTGPEGATVEHVTGEDGKPTPTHLFIVKPAPDAAPHMWRLIERMGEAPDFSHRRLMPGQSNLAMLIDECVRRIEQAGEIPSITISTSLDAIMVEEGALSDEDPKCPSYHGKIVLCREGGDSLPDRWNSVQFSEAAGRIDCNGAHSRFHETALGEHIRGALSTEADNTKLGPWKMVALRPRWSAKQICPDAFPPPPKIPAEHEARVAAFQGQHKKNRKAKVSQQRALENAKVEQEHQHRAIDAQQQRYK